MSTYLEMHVEALRRTINEGGSQAEIDAAVERYNVFDREAFAQWLPQAGKMHCSTCGTSFDAPATAQPHDEVLCESHGR